MARRAISPATTSQISATFAEFGEFEEVTGGDSNQVQVEHYDPGAQSATLIPGTHSFSDLVLTRDYDAQRDRRLIEYVDRYMNKLEGPRTVTRTTRDQQGRVIDTITYSVCKPKTLGLPSGRAGGNDMARISITLGVEAII